MPLLAPGGKRVQLLGLFGAVSTLTNFLEGYSSSYPNTAGDSFQEFINGTFVRRHHALSEWSYTFLWSSFLNVWFCAYLAGTCATPFFTERFGRKKSLLGANLCTLCGSIVSALAIVFDLYELLFAGRVIAAAASGVSFGALILFLQASSLPEGAINKAFLQETTPTHLRGQCSFLSEVSFLATNLIGMAAGMNFIFGKHLLLLLGFAVIPCTLSVVIMLPLKESPKHLLLHSKDQEAAAQAIRFYQGDHVNVDDILNEMLKETVEKTDEMGSWQATLELWRRPSLRKAVFIGVLALQLAVAIWPIDFLSTTLLQAHFSTDVAQVSSLTFVSTNFVASLIGMMIVEKCGRRKLLIGAGIANTLCLVAYMISDRLAFHAHTSFKYGCIASLVAFAFTYGFGLGGIAYIISSEIAPQRFRSLVQSVVFFVNTVSNFLFSFASLPLYRLIDVWSFLPLFIIPSCLSLVYLYFNMPETRNREIHEIVEIMSTGSRSPTSSHMSTSSDNSVSVKTLDSAETLSTDESEEKPAAQYSSNLRLAQELEAGKELDGKKEVV